MLGDGSFGSVKKVEDLQSKEMYTEYLTTFNIAISFNLFLLV